MTISYSLLFKEKVEQNPSFLLYLDATNSIGIRQSKFEMSDYEKQITLRYLTGLIAGLDE
jgi:hypothetical protein